MIVHGLIYYLIFLISIVLHEAAHAKTALLLGDDSDDVKKRITLNPLPHIDIFGTLFIPIALFVSGSTIVFGWAKPVMVRSGAIRGGHKGMALISFAGPAANLIVAGFLIVVLKFSILFFQIKLVFYEYFLFGILINIVLFLLNMMPVPPLDGSALLSAVLKEEWRVWYLKYGVFFMIPLMLLIFFGLFDGTIVYLFDYIRTVLL